MLDAIESHVEGGQPEEPRIGDMSYMGGPPPEHGGFLQMPGDANMMEGHSGGMLTMPDGQPGMPMMGDGQPGMAMMADAMPSSNGFSYVRLRGLPFAASEQEIQMWFSSAPGGPLQALRVLFTYNTSGRKSGEAFIELPEMMADRAVQVLNNRHLGTRYIEVFLSSEAEMSQSNVTPPAPGAGPAGGGGYDMQGGGGAPVGGSHGVCKLRGLPFNATPEMVVQFFGGFELPMGAAGVHMVLGPNGRPNGEAFVEFGTEEAADAAMVKDRQTLGSRCAADSQFGAQLNAQFGAQFVRNSRRTSLTPAALPSAGTSSCSGRRPSR